MLWPWVEIYSGSIIMLAKWSFLVCKSVLVSVSSLNLAIKLLSLLINEVIDPFVCTWPSAIFFKRSALAATKASNLSWYFTSINLGNGGNILNKSSINWPSRGLMPGIIVKPSNTIVLVFLSPEDARYVTETIIVPSSKLASPPTVSIDSSSLKTFSSI